MKTAEKFIIHYVPTADNIDAHTHGLYEEFEHKELQLALPLTQNAVAVILNMLAKEIENGFVLEPNLIYQEPFNAQFKCVPLYDVKTGKKADILRVIISDKNGFFPEEQNCDEVFKGQYNTVGDLSVNICH